MLQSIADPILETTCDFCTIKYHIQCAGFRKVPAKTKSWICTVRRSLPATLQAATGRLLLALDKIDRLEKELLVKDSREVLFVAKSMRLRRKPVI